jgi:hypothetical protein
VDALYRAHFDGMVCVCVCVHAQGVSHLWRDIHLIASLSALTALLRGVRQRASPWLLT